MDTRFVRKLARMAFQAVLILAFAFSGVTTANAAFTSPFIGQWEAADLDGGDIRLTIAGGVKGMYSITWTESNLGVCDGGPGIVRGSGWINPEDANLLEADLHVRCFLTGTELDFHIAWRYHPATNLLSSGQGGFITLWHRPGLPPRFPRLDLRVQYGGDWVESFYEAGHTAWVTVFAGDGATVKGTSQLITEPKDYWGGEPGFQSMDSVWYDADGNLMDNPPDIRPYDWVYGWIDNGASARVQIGNIRGVVDLTNDSISGTILVEWFSDEVPVECFPWGAPGPQPENKFDSVLPDGADTYACNWVNEWDIQDGQVVGVGYFGADGHWVANEFRNPRFDVFPEWNFVEGWEWPEGDLVTATVAGKAECIGEGTPGYLPDNPWSTYVGIGFPEGCDIAAGDELTLSNSMISLSHTVRDLAVTEVSAAENWVLGTSTPAEQLRVWAHGYDPFKIFTTSDENGAWGVDFDDTGFDLLAGMSGRVSIADDLGNTTAVDWMAPETLIVGSTADALANDGVCTLREAVIAANTNAPSGDMPGECPAGLDPVPDTIVLSADQVYSLTLDSTYEDSALDGDLDFWDNSAGLDVILTVADGGRATISQDAAVDDRVLHILGPVVRLENLTLTGGSEGGIGGGILNHSGLELYGVEVNGNSAGWSGGGIFNTDTASLYMEGGAISNNASLGTGGAGLSNEGTAGLTGCEVAGNVAAHDGGGIANNGTLSVDNCAIHGNTATGAGGGGLANLYSRTVTLQNGTQVYENSAMTGGGLFNYGEMAVLDSTVSANTSDYGGGISVWAGTLTLDNSAVTGNTALNDAGGIHVTGSGTANLQNGSQVTGNTTTWSGGGVAVWDTGTLNVTDSAITGNTSDSGGGIANWSVVNLSGGSVSDNNAAWGGGIATFGGTLTLDASSVSGNTAVNDAGGIFIRDAAVVAIQNGSLVGGNSANWGGGISTWGSTLTIDASTISENTANNSGGGLLMHEGGTVSVQNGSLFTANGANWGAGLSNWDASLTITDSTISSNTAAALGGGLENGGTLVVTGSAFLGNTAGYDGGAVWSFTGVPYATTVMNSCIAGNSVTAVANPTGAVQNFTVNWWGDPSGPGGAGGGLGDTVGPYIDFFDWLSEAPPTCAAALRNAPR